MPIPPKKLEAFANQKNKDKGFPPLPKKGKLGKLLAKRHDDDEEGHEHDEHGQDVGHEGHDDHHDHHDQHSKGHGGDENGGKHVDVQAIGKKVQDGHGDPHLMDLASGVNEEHNPPEWVADEATWEKAKKAVEPHKDEYDEPWGVTVHVYKAMGGKFKRG